jgi:hypothetical protein
VRGYDNALWTKRMSAEDLASGNWASLGGYCSSDSTSVMDHPNGSVIVVVRDNENYLEQKVFGV